ncbi:hypothetical protein [Belnapia sp. F-4-1]|uniref:hypothetical protein n=1 Tax=Belnapia sp. F-4-1 TaxID=1545443 RepID=UPI00118510E7|nr:hypothetical protein [Belnapia sp. F-4-1]
MSVSASPSLLLMAALAAAAPAQAGGPDLAAEARAGLPVAGGFEAASPRRWSPVRGVTLSLLPVRFAPRVPSFPNQQRWCGVAVDGAGAVESFVTLGTDWTEAVSCNGLREAGEVPAVGGVPRFALVYEASSPNTVLRVPVILRWEAGRAVLDAEASQRVGEAGRGGSLERIRAALRPR